MVALQSNVGFECRIPQQIVCSPDMAWVGLAHGGANPIKTAKAKINAAWSRNGWDWIENDVFVTGLQGRTIFLGVRFARLELLPRLAAAFDAIPARPYEHLPMLEVYATWSEPDHRLMVDDVVRLTPQDLGFGLKEFGGR